MSDIPRGRGPDCRGRACLEQIWNRFIAEGERDLALYALYQGLQTARQSEGYARQWVERKNAILLAPLTARELSQIMHGPEAKRPGHTYEVGCPWVQRNLPWVICSGCHYLNEGVRCLVDGYKAIQAVQDVNGAAFKVYFVLLRAKQETGTMGLSLTEAVQRTGLSKSTVQAAFKELHDKGYL